MTGDRFGRTIVERMVLADHIVAEDPAYHFVIDEPVVIRPGSVISATDDALTIEHPDGSVTHHPGNVEVGCPGWFPRGSEIGRRITPDQTAIEGE